MIGILLGTLLGAGFCCPAAVQLANRFSHTPSAWPLREFVIAAVLLAVVFSVSVARRGAAFTLFLLPLAVLGGAAALVDAREFRLPDPLVGALAVVTIGLVALAVPLFSRGFTVPLAALSIGVGISALLLVLTPAAWGWGDAKLLPVLSCWLGVVGPAAAYYAAAFTALTLLPLAAWRVRRSGPGAVTPYGPSLVSATLLACTLG